MDSKILPIMLRWAGLDGAKVREEVIVHEFELSPYEIQIAIWRERHRRRRAKRRRRRSA